MQFKCGAKKPTYVLQMSKTRKLPGHVVPLCLWTRLVFIFFLLQS